MTTYNALRRAADIYRRRATLDREQALECAVELAQFRAFSNRHIADFTGLPRTAVDRVSRKPERTGGRFVPEALEPTLVLLRKRLDGENDWELAAKIVDLGVSVNYLAKLAGFSQSVLARRLAAR